MMLSEFLERMPTNGWYVEDGILRRYYIAPSGYMIRQCPILAVYYTTSTYPPKHWYTERDVFDAARDLMIPSKLAKELVYAADHDLPFLAQLHALGKHSLDDYYRISGIRVLLLRKAGLGT